jgi:hypothetical protein
MTVKGDPADHDYFIDINISLPHGRAIFGAVFTVCTAIVEICLRSVYRSYVRRQLGRPTKPKVKLWDVSPASTPSEVLATRKILFQKLRSGKPGEVFFAVTSLSCIMTAILNASSTVIANHTIVTRIATRRDMVPGVLVTSHRNTVDGAAVEISNRYQALNKSGAPLEQLFDFVPDDASGWIFEEDKWNNTWKGSCSYELLAGVDLTVYQSNSSLYQDEIPGLGQYLPPWATVDPTRQGNDYSGYTNDNPGNSTGAWQDVLIIYVFGSVPPVNNLTFAPSAINISIANLLLHEVGRAEDANYLETAFRSDVNIVECQFENSSPGIEDQAGPQVGQYANAALNVASVRFQRLRTTVGCSLCIYGILAL